MMLEQLALERATWHWNEDVVIMFVTDIWRSAVDNSCRSLRSCTSDPKYSHRIPHKQVCFL